MAGTVGGITYGKPTPYGTPITIGGTSVYGSGGNQRMTYTGQAPAAPAAPPAPDPSMASLGMMAGGGSPQYDQSSPAPVYNFNQAAPPQMPNIPPQSMAPAASAAPQTPASILALGGAADKPLDSINEDAMPTLRANLGMRSAPSLTSLFAQLPRIY